MVSTGKTQPQVAPMGIPVGGVAGTPLVKASGVNNATLWQMPPTVYEPFYFSGGWYDNRVLAYGSQSASTPTANRNYYLPLFLPFPVTIDAMGFFGVISAGVVVSLGVLTATSTGLPGTLVGVTQTAWFGTAGSATSIVGAFTNSVTIPAGWSYLGLTTNGSTTIYGHTAIPSRSPVPNPSGIGVANYVWLRDTTTGAGWVSNPAASWSSANIAPVVYFRVA